MNLQQKIKEQIKEAMMARDQVRLDTLRSVLAAFTNELVAKKRKPSEELSDEDCLGVISRLVKQRRDSIDQFRKGGREDLVKEEEAQLKILEIYLPQMMSRAEIEKIVRAKKEELGLVDKSKSGVLMSALMKELKGRADGQIVKEVVENLF